MGSVVKKNKQSKATSGKDAKPKMVGRFVVIPSDKVKADRCSAYAYIF
jgi:hypothetical protein